ncbi:metallophosphoesterase [Ignatzschineria sp. LJL83]
MFKFILIFYYLAQTYVLWRYYQLLPANKGLQIIGLLVALVLSVSLPLSIFMARDLPLWLVKPLYMIGSTWMVILLYVFVPVLLLDIFRILNHFGQWISADKINAFRTHNGWLLSCLILLYAGIIFWGNQHYHDKIRVEYQYDLASKTATLMDDSELKLPVEACSIDQSQTSFPLKIVMLSDLHLGHTIGREELEVWKELINAENADYIFVSGDVIDNDVRPLYAENIEELLSEFKAKKGVYAVLGNHEYIAGVENSIAFLNKTNWHLLRDDVVLLPENIYLIGRDDKMNRNRAELSELMEGLDPNVPAIVLDHQPINFAELSKLGQFLQFSGHTHDGQVWPYNYMAKNINGVSSGLWDFNQSQLLISAGIGIWGGKFRIGTRSDYRILNICQ